MRPSSIKRSPYPRLVALAVASLVLFTAIATLTKSPTRAQIPPQHSSQLAQGGMLRVRDVWQQVYELLPDLPKENHHISTETGEPAEDNTLIDRLIRYHVYIQNRPTQFRLDWKLTLADYLGANKIMRPEQYPRARVLRENPLEGDKKAIGSLNRQQRDALVDVLVGIFNPSAANAVSERQPPADPPSTPPPSNAGGNRRFSLPPLPQPGDSELLLP
ncbi:hypothetical protein ACOKW7_00475 [Limnospira platensis CENA597]|uniref:hypothetical protein n=1 Tax=Limnospira platensis TaxID=118562 RepID=UPI003D6E2BFA